MSVLDIRPTNEYWNMKKRVQTIESTNKEECIAILTVKQFPKTSRGEERLVNWLRKVADQIESSDPHAYAKNCRFRLMSQTNIRERKQL